MNKVNNFSNIFTESMLMFSQLLTKILSKTLSSEVDMIGWVQDLRNHFETEGIESGLKDIWELVLSQTSECAALSTTEKPIIAQHSPHNLITCLRPRNLRDYLGYGIGTEKQE